MEKWRFQFQPDQRRSLVLSCPTHTKTTSLEKRLPTSEESCVEHAGGRDTERVTLEDKGGTRRLNRVAVLETQESHGGRHSPAHPSRSGGRERGETLQTKSNMVGWMDGREEATMRDRRRERANCCSHACRHREQWAWAHNELVAVDGHGHIHTTQTMKLVHGGIVCGVYVCVCGCDPQKTEMELLTCQLVSPGSPEICMR